MKRLRLGRVLVLSCLIVVGAAQKPAATGERRDPRAVSVAEAVERTMAPNGGWEKIAGLRFSFTVVKDGKTLKSYEHLWDTRSGRYRVEGEGPEGGRFIVLFDVNTRHGDAWMMMEPGARTAVGTTGDRSMGTSPAGTVTTPAADVATPGGGQPPMWLEQEGDKAVKLLEWAYERFINDSYWLLMPLKMKDPGVNLGYEGEKTLEGGEPCEIIKLTFNGVGLTPGDTYWVFVNKRTHLVDRWEFVLEGQEAKDKSAFERKDWRSFGPLRLATSHPKADGKVAIVFTGVAALDAIPPGSFDPPKPSSM